MMLMPATDLARVEEALGQCETLVLYKAGKHVDALLDLLERKGLAGRARLMCYAEQGEKEFATTDLREAVGSRHGYLATVIVHVSRQPWNAPTRGQPKTSETVGVQNS